MNSKKKKTIYYHVNEIILKDIYPIDIGHESHSLRKKPFKNKYPYFLLHYVTNGEGIIEIDGKQNSFDKNSVFILPPNKEIIYRPQKNVAEKNPTGWSYYWINFNGLEIKKILSTLGITEEKFFFSDKFIGLEKYFENVFDQQSSEIERYYAAMSALFGIFSELNPTALSDVRQKKTTSFDEIFEYIQNHIYDTDLSATKVADAFYITGSYFSKLFRKNLNTSFPNFVNYERIKKATTLLVTTDLPVKVIANNVGYKDALYFSKIFKKYRLSSPESYRLDCKNDK